MSEIPSFVPSKKKLRVSKINVDTPSSAGKEVATIQEPQDPKINGPIPEKDNYYPEKKNKNKLRKKKKNAILNMPGGVNTTDVLRRNGIHTKPLHRKLTPSQKKSMLMDQEMNDDYYDDDYIGLPAPIGGFKVDSFRHPKKCLSPLPSQEEQFRQRNFSKSQITNKKTGYRVGGSDENYNNCNNKSLNSFIENNLAPKGNKKSNQNLPSSTFNESSKMHDTMKDYNYPNNTNNKMKFERPEKKQDMQYQAPNAEHHSNGRELQERQLNHYFELNDSHCSSEPKPAKTLYSQCSTNSNTYNPIDPSDLNAVVSLIRMAINNKDKKNRKKKLSTMDLLYLVQAAIKDNEDTNSDFESDANIIEYKRIYKKGKKKCVANNKKIKRSKKKKDYTSDDTETETGTSDTDFECGREKKKRTKKKKTEKFMKKKDYYTASDSDSNFESDSSFDSNPDFEYGRKYDRYNSRKKINLLQYEPDFDLEDQRQRQRHKKKKKKMQKLMLRYESENSSDSSSDSDYYYTGKLKNTVTRRAEEQNEVRIRREQNRKKASKKKLFSKWDYSDNEYLMKRERQTEALKEMEENYNQMKKEFLKMKMTMEGSKDKKVSNEITVEEPDGVISEGVSQRYKPKLLTYNNRSLGNSNGYKRNDKLISKSIDYSDESCSNNKKKKVKSKFKNFLNESSSESEFDSDYYESEISKTKTESKPNPIDSCDELYSDFEDKKQRRDKKYKKKPFKVESDFSDCDSNSQFEEKKSNRGKTKSKKKISSKPQSFTSESDSFTEYEEQKKISNKGKKKEKVVCDSDSDSDSGSDFYDVKTSSQAKSKPNPMESADESFSDYEEKKSKKSKNVNRRR